MATKQNSGLPRPRDSLLQLAANCFARAPAASGKGKGTRSVANPGDAKQAGRNVGAPPARRNLGERGIPARAPAESGKGKGTRSVANPSPPSPARFKRRVWKSYRVSPNFRPTASEIIRKVESCMSVSPFSRRATYSLFLPILSASCC